MHAALLTLAAAVIAAPVPKGKEAKLYFPTTVGTKLVSESKLEMKKGGWRDERVETVTKVEEKNGVYTVTQEQQNAPKEFAAMVYRVSADGVSRVSVGDAVTDPPVAVLKLGVNPGEAWTAEEKVPTFGAAPAGPAGRTRKWTFTMGREEEVEVPAGRFKTLRVDHEGEGSEAKTSVWYAVGVGVVKSETVAGDKKMVTCLKEFTPGDGKPKAEPKMDK